MTHRISTITIALVLTLVAFSLFPAILPKVAAAEATPLPLCAGENVSGTVVAVDETTQTVTVNTSTGLCTVTIKESTSTHPIVALLGQYFGDIKAGSLLETLGGAEGCALLDPVTNIWNSVDCTVPGSVPIQYSGKNTDGTYDALPSDNGLPITVTVGLTYTAGLDQALAGLGIDWKLDANGDVIQASDEIAQYHDEGMGFGVLVKLYAMAAESQADCAATPVTEPATDPAAQPVEACGMTVEQLVAEFQSGVGLGQMFKEHGKPGLMGVGQVRKQMALEQETGGDDAGIQPGSESSTPDLKNNGQGKNKNKPVLQPTPEQPQPVVEQPAVQPQQLLPQKPAHQPHQNQPKVKSHGNGNGNGNGKK